MGMQPSYRHLSTPVYIKRSSPDRPPTPTHTFHQNMSQRYARYNGCAVVEMTHAHTRGRYHGGRRPSSDDSSHSPTVIPPSALDKPSVMKRYHRRRTCSHTSPRCSPTMETLHDSRFVECRWWNDGWTVKTVVTSRSSASMMPAPVYTR